MTHNESLLKNEINVLQVRYEKLLRAYNELAAVTKEQAIASRILYKYEVYSK